MAARSVAKSIPPTKKSQRESSRRQPEPDVQSTLKVCELVRRVLVTTCSIDPVPQFVPVLARLSSSGVVLSDVLCDSGYAHRRAEHWALPVRRLGARLVMDLHPSDRGVRGTYKGAVLHNGTLYCPSTPKALLDVQPLARSASKATIDAHDATCEELAHYKLGRITTDDAEGFHRVMCPAVMGKVRCELRPTSMSLAMDHPQVLEPPHTPPPCCVQQTLTVPPSVNAKTAQRHDYPSAAHRSSYARRTAVERSYSTLKDPASTDVTRGWCRVMGLSAITLFFTCAVVVRNARVVDAFEAREQDNAQRQRVGLEPRSRRHRRRTIDDLLEPKAA